MVVRRPNGKLITAKKTFYPPGAFRLLTGGVGHGELIAAALLREVAEETGLDVVVRRFLAVIEYQLREMGDGGRGIGDGLPIPILHPPSPQISLPSRSCWMRPAARCRRTIRASGSRRSASWRWLISPRWPKRWSMFLTRAMMRSMAPGAIGAAFVPWRIA